ncbi:hypothetical protein [Sodalis sp.]
MRDILPAGRFIKVFVDTQLAVCEACEPNQKGYTKSPRRRAA